MAIIVGGRLQLWPTCNLVGWELSWGWMLSSIVVLQYPGILSPQPNQKSWDKRSQSCLCKYLLSRQRAGWRKMKTGFKVTKEECLENLKNSENIFLDL
jgi:hypothetical protein